MVHSFFVGNFTKTFSPSVLWAGCIFVWNNPQGPISTNSNDLVERNDLIVLNDVTPTRINHILTQTENALDICLVTTNLCRAQWQVIKNSSSVVDILLK